MARTIPRGLSGILEELELERPRLVMMSQLADICERRGVRTPAKVVASRLRERGWLLPTSQRGVWEFAPAELAGAYSSADPLLSLKVYAAARPTDRFALAAQTAAWALGFADRLPSTLDAAFIRMPASVPDGVRASAYEPNIPTIRTKGLTALAPESIVVHMVQRPSAIRSWRSVGEWLPDIAYEIDTARAVEELSGRPRSVSARAGYLLQGMRPDVAEAIMEICPPRSKVRFGTGLAIRNDEKWQVSDCVLPFDPRKMEEVL